MEKTDTNKSSQLMTSHIQIDENRVYIQMSSELKDGLMNMLNNLLADVLIEEANKLKGSNELTQTTNKKADGWESKITQCETKITC